MKSLVESLLDDIDILDKNTSKQMAVKVIFDEVVKANNSSPLRGRDVFNRKIEVGDLVFYMSDLQFSVGVVKNIDEHSRLSLVGPEDHEYRMYSSEVCLIPSKYLKDFVKIIS